MDELINTYLKELEQEHNIKIIYACDTGSRSKSLDSKFSDYDIKFIYIHTEYELNFDSNRKLLKIPNFITIQKDDDLFEFKGYTLDRAIDFLLNFNSEIINIMYSPKVYIKNSLLKSKFYDMLLKVYDQKSMTYQLINMMKSHYKKDVMKKDIVSPKKYIHLIHTILKINFVLNNDNPEIITLHDFNDCFDYNIQNGFIQEDMKQEIDILLKLKRSSNYEPIPKIPIIDSKIEKLLKVKISSLDLQTAPEIDSKEFYLLMIELLKVHL
ncbi:MAG: hypothetical protein CMF62_03665 [Magnetococcales bacterium]|nr:hypothetical protein [Magnetococcales bacterium]|tara:strand:+ start:13685 stop:14488 length:804 start_codon:yes stop_codon:yes gene_type:complete